MRARALPLALTAVLFTGACTASPDDDAEPEEQVAQVMTAVPGSA
ncbi:hypothetical protein [Blastococcus brunescens]|uniref:Uncharacterized protein n=1 Tax=Blastococcus brunescens TaxID=1564165 RepID=A0ABZ1B6A0_9ACTN|nr:hypothetical protein [Blastococcus sp. BMG 8361]WRL65358.1 hypothetical protein U6N30_06910 [Blastococcus sp. BMG 8361]